MAIIGKARARARPKAFAGFQFHDMAPLYDNVRSQRRWSLSLSRSKLAESPGLALRRSIERDRALRRGGLPRRAESVQPLIKPSSCFHRPPAISVSVACSTGWPVAVGSASNASTRVAYY